MRKLTLALAVLVIAAAAAIGFAVWVTSDSAGPSASPPAEATPTARPTPAPTPTAEPRYDYPDADSVGTCYNPIVDKDDGYLLAMRIQDCDDPHLSELIGAASIDEGPAADWPGQDEVDREAADLCLTAFEDYVGIAFDRSSLDATYIAPTEAQWQGGDRVVICTVDTTSASPFTSTVRDLKE